MDHGNVHLFGGIFNMPGTFQSNHDLGMNGLEVTAQLVRRTIGVDRDGAGSAAYRRQADTKFGTIGHGNTHTISGTDTVVPGKRIEILDEVSQTIVSKRRALVRVDGQDCRPSAIRQQIDKTGIFQFLFDVLPNDGVLWHAIQDLEHWRRTKARIFGFCGFCRGAQSQ